MPIKEGLVAEYDHEIATTRKLLERIPDDRLSWKPHDKSRSMGALATHLANLPVWTDTILNNLSFDLTGTAPHPPELTSTAEILRAFDTNATRARAWMDRTDAEYNAPWTLKRDEQVMFTIPRIAAFRSWVLGHLVHHRGQLSVYLRLNDLPVPPIYGPSADEG